MNRHEIQTITRVMKALSSPIRLRIVHELQQGERCLCELQPLFPRHKSTLSRHIALLKRLGLLTERREGVRRVLRLQVPCLVRFGSCLGKALQPSSPFKGEGKGARR